MNQIAAGLGIPDESVSSKDALAAFAMRSRFQAGAMLTAVAVGSSLSQPLWMTLHHRVERMNVAIAALMVAGAGAALFPFLVMQGLLSTVLVSALYGTGVGGLFFLLWTSIARQAARNHGTSGATATIGAFSGSAKLGQAAAILAVGLYLEQARASTGTLSGSALLALMAVAVFAALALLLLIAKVTQSSLARDPSNNVRSVS